LKGAIGKYKEFITGLEDLKKEIQLVKGKFLERDKDFFKGHYEFGDLIEKQTELVDEQLEFNRKKLKDIKDVHAYLTGIANT
jgi:hypothetical protein